MVVLLDFPARHREDLLEVLRVLTTCSNGLFLSFLCILYPEILSGPQYREVMISNLFLHNPSLALSRRLCS